MKCKCLTLKGIQCKNAAQKNSQFCHLHQKCKGASAKTKAKVLAKEKVVAKPKGKAKAKTRSKIVHKASPDIFDKYYPKPKAKAKNVRFLDIQYDDDLSEEDSLWPSPQSSSLSSTGSEGSLVEDLGYGSLSDSWTPRETYYDRMSLKQLRKLWGNMGKPTAGKTKKDLVKFLAE
ncbi:MAG TPA: hypothetical protein PKD85_15580 [Saprospiraceae bacterium]|nr:hypothetical protein [Saprospiraceae bacterium]